ncbi:MAG: hypothetical protein WAN46_05990 [Gammaproteobacteria bacterium]
MSQTNNTVILAGKLEAEIINDHCEKISTLRHLGLRFRGNDGQNSGWNQFAVTMTEPALALITTSYPGFHDNKV